MTRAEERLKTLTEDEEQVDGGIDILDRAFCGPGGGAHRYPRIKEYEGLNSSKEVYGRRTSQQNVGYHLNP